MCRCHGAAVALIALLRAPDVTAAGAAADACAKEIADCARDSGCRASMVSLVGGLGNAVPVGGMAISSLVECIGATFGDDFVAAPPPLQLVPASAVVIRKRTGAPAHYKPDWVLDRGTASDPAAFEYYLRFTAEAGTGAMRNTTYGVECVHEESGMATARKHLAYGHATVGYRSLLGQLGSCRWPEGNACTRTGRAESAPTARPLWQLLVRP